MSAFVVAYIGSRIFGVLVTDVENVQGVIDSINANILAQNGDVGELKLFVDAVKIIIKTVEIP